MSEAGQADRRHGVKELENALRCVWHQHVISELLHPVAPMACTAHESAQVGREDNWLWTTGAREARRALWRMRIVKTSWKAETICWEGVQNQSSMVLL